jgi:DOPA 4,5-dioxygenase
MVTRPTNTAPPPQTDLKTVVESRNREWHFHIYFLIQSKTDTAAALALRDAVLRLRRDGESPRSRAGEGATFGDTGALT